jgi:hexulose-6-phosphate isomerase
MPPLTRRQFSQLPLFAAPWLAGLTPISAQPKLRGQFPPPPRPRELKLAARISCEGREGPLTRRLAGLRAAGFDGVEAVWPGTFRGADLRAAARAAECPVHAVHVGLGFDAALSKDDSNLRQQGQERLTRALELAAELGAGSVSVVPGAITPEVSDARAWNLVKIGLGALLPRASELGLRLGLRLGPGDFLASPLEAARFLDELDSPALGWQLDTGWSLLRSYPQHWIHILGQRILKVDLSDFSRGAAAAGGTEAGFKIQLGEGDLDFPATLEALAHALYSGWLSLAVDDAALEESGPNRKGARTALQIAQRARALLEM